jgi:hypothetical protein
MRPVVSVVTPSIAGPFSFVAHYASPVGIKGLAAHRAVSDRTLPIWPESRTGTRTILADRPVFVVCRS